jgi:hypothetical protein
MLLVLSLGKYLSGAVESGTLWSEGIASLAERILVGNAIHSIHSIEFVRSGEMHLHFGSIHANDLAASIPFVSSGTPFAYELFLLQNPEARATQTTFANSTYLGILYAEGGWTACIFTYLILGIVLARVSEWFFASQKTATNAGFAGLTGMYLGEVTLTSASHCLVLIGVLLFVTKLYWFLLPSVSHGVARTGKTVASFCAIGGLSRQKFEARR